MRAFLLAMATALSAVLAPVSLPFPPSALAQDGGLRDQGSGIVTRPSAHPAQETMDRIAAAAASQGVVVFSRIDYQQMSKKAGVEIRPNQLFIVGGRGGPLLIKEAPLVGIDLPLKVLVWEDAQGKVWVSYTNGSYVARRYAVAGAAGVVAAYDEMIDRLIADTLK